MLFTLKEFGDVKFNSKHTEEEAFHVTKGHSQRVTLMSRTAVLATSIMLNLKDGQLVEIL